MTSPPPEGVALAEGLREIRARTGLSLAALAERTPYSKSSWERYLNGKKEIPRQAVEALCALAGEPPGRLLVLWELADAEWSGRARYGTPADPPPPSPGADADRGNAPRGSRRSRWWHPSVASTVLAAMTVLAYAALSLTGADSRGPARPATSVPDTPVGCRLKACDGKNPEAMSCGLPGRVAVVGSELHTRTEARLEIRYSSSCGAAWGRIWHSKVGDAIEVSAPGVRSRGVTVKNETDAGAYLFTPMIGVRDPDNLQLCFLPTTGEPRECFQS